MNRNPVARIEFTFGEDAKEYFAKLVKELVAPEQYYSSPVKPSINGDVTHNLHYTAFYGIDINKMDSQELKDLITEYDFKNIEIGDLFLMPGFQNLYKILCIKVEDPTGRLEEFANKANELSKDKNIKLKEFKPRLTLAYVTNDYEVIPEPSEKIVESIDVDGVVISKGE